MTASRASRPKPVKAWALVNTTGPCICPATCRIRRRELDRGMDWMVPIRVEIRPLPPRRRARRKGK